MQPPDPPRDAVAVLKDEIRQLEEQVPALNAGLSELRDELHAAERDLRAAPTPAADQRVAEARAAFERAQAEKRAFLHEKERRIELAKRALSARREAAQRRLLDAALAALEARLGPAEGRPQV